MRNNIKAIILFLFFLFSGLFAIAQEELTPLSVNPVLVEKYKVLKAKQNLRTQTTNNYTYYKADTLSLPFIDDFSYNYLAAYFKEQYPAAAISQTTFYKYQYNGTPFPDSIYLNVDTAFNYQFDIVNRKAIRYPKPSNGNLSFYSFPGYGYNFTTPDSVITTWPSYFLPVAWDSINGNLIDSVLVTNKFVQDTNIVDVVDMSFLPGKWLDSDVFINHDYAISPVTVGVATFDGLDSAGMPRNFASPNSYGVSDYLTSKPINLSGKTAADSVYLSFHIQQGGNGNNPQENDSIVVEFYNSIQKTWDYKWKRTSSYPDEDTVFYFIALPITDSAYLNRDFKFRFKNYATLSGSFDNWNLDYVKLNETRTYNDNSYDDVAFVNDQESLLKNLTAVPYKQYSTNLVKDKIYNRIVNLNKTTPKAIIDYYYQIKDKQDNIIFTSNSSATNMGSGINICNFCDGIKEPPISSLFTFPLVDSCMFYKVEQTFTSAPDEILTNNTISLNQHISNYYAYDDGTAEAGYGLNTQYGKIAYKFQLSTADVLTAVRFYFNPLMNDVSTKQFTIMIWDDIAGVPGNIISSETNFVSPVYGVVQNNFVEYSINPVNLPAGIFYVGWQQVTADRLNIGFDVNTNNSTNMYYNVLGQWDQSIYSGSWLLRPVFGACPFETNGIEESLASEAMLSVFPNPANDQIFIHTNSNEVNKVELHIFDITGKLVFSKLTDKNESIDISSLAKGMYLVKLKTLGTEQYYTQKLIIE